MVRSAAAVLILAALTVASSGQTPRRLATVASLHQYPGYYHLQNVLVHGEFVESDTRVVLRGGERDITVLLNDARSTSGLAEVRGYLMDVGRLEPGDPRLRAYAAPEPDRWPRPGEELVLSVTDASDAQLATTPSVRGLALQPWRFEGQTVTVVGQFRGRNLFGDLPSAPARSRYDFVLRSADAAVWVTDLRPRGRDFELSVDARVDTGRWLEVTGVVALERGLVTIRGSRLAAAEPQDLAEEEEEAAPAVPLLPAEVVFSSPYEGEIDVPPTTSIRIQFSRGIDPKTLAGQIRVSYVGVAPTGAAEAQSLRFEQSYDPGTRAVELTFAEPLDRFRTLRVELLEDVKAFDGAPVTAWMLTFSVGG